MDLDGMELFAEMWDDDIWAGRDEAVSSELDNFLHLPSTQERVSSSQLNNPAEATNLCLQENHYVTSLVAVAWEEDDLFPAEFILTTHHFLWSCNKSYISA